MPRKFAIEFALEKYIQRRGVGSLVPLMYFISAEAEEIWEETGDPRARRAADFLEKAALGVSRAIGPSRSKPAARKPTRRKRK